MVKKIFLLLLLLFFFTFATYHSQAQESYERFILVFKSETTRSAKFQLINQKGLIWGKELQLINAQAVRMPKSMIAILNKHPLILRIDQDVKVQALENDFPMNQSRVQANSICDWFPSWSGCAKPSPTPSIIPSPIPTPSPSSLPSSSPTTSPTPSSSPITSPSSSPTPLSSVSPSPNSTQNIPWGVTKINAPQAWDKSTGDNVKVAVIDSGIDRNHPDLINNIAGCVNFINSNKTCEDNNGHGTHVSGIIAAENNNIGVVGVAPKAKIYSLKALDSRGGGYLSDIIEALDWSINNGMQIINMSLGTTSNITSLRDAVIRVNNAGILQVVSAGNSGSRQNTVNYPAKYSEVLAVSATDTNDSVPYWSSRGIEVDLAAPGVNINSTYINDNYTTMSGTSMSAPCVTGVAALRKQFQPSESLAQLKSVLINNTDALSLDITLIGSGRINAYKVVTAQ